MQQYKCDIIIVGAGPAGSMAAKAAAEKGNNVIIIEEHETPGTPVYCAEGLSIGGIKDGGLEAVPPYVTQQISTARIFAPNGKSFDLTADNWTGYTLDRQVFDRTLTENAVKEGAILMTKTKATDVIKEGKQIVGIKAVKEGEEVEFRAKVVIGADGHWSIIRRRAGLQRYFSDYVTCAQYQLGRLDLNDPSANEFYMGERYAPGGYAWVFPKSKSVANVGLGVRKKHTKAPIEYLKDFCNNDPRFRNAKILKTSGGICPVSGTLDKIIMDGLILIGDAAGMLVPMTGAGIHCGIESGKMAGKVAVEAVIENDVSEVKLNQFRVMFDKYWGKRIKESGKVLEMLDRFNDEDLNTLAEIINNDDILALANGENVAAALAGIVKRSPGKLMQLIRAYLR
ncbi:geranylgeranyl reductase family protein [Thermoproteota archaeon]